MRRCDGDQTVGTRQRGHARDDARREFERGTGFSCQPAPLFFGEVSE